MPSGDAAQADADRAGDPVTGAWPGWRGFLRGTWTIARTGGGVRAVVADVVEGVRWWLRPPAPTSRWSGEQAAPAAGGAVRSGPVLVGEQGPELTDIPPGTRFTYVHGPVRDTDQP